MSPAWSPDGRWLAFVRALAGETRELYIAPAMGGSERKIIEFQSLEEMRIAWGPDSRWLVFTDRSAGLDASYGLYRVSVRTGERRQLTSPGHLQADADAAVSPDGRTIAFVRSSGKLRQLFSIRLNEAGDPVGAPTPLLSKEPSARFPAWTSDGAAIIVELGRTLPYLARLRIGADRVEPLVFPGGEASQPAISPRGNRLAFVRIHYDTNIWKHTIDARGGTATVQWPCSSTYLDRQPRFSDDGSKVAFISNRSGTEAIWVCDAAGSNPTHVADLNDEVRGVLNWGPDARSIVVNHTKHAYSVDLDSGAVRHLSLPGFVSKDGKWTYFNSTKRGRVDIWKAATEGGEHIQLTRDGGQLLANQVGGGFIYYVKPLQVDSRSQLSMPSTQMSLWRMPISGGPEEKLVDALSAPINFGVTEDGIYFIPAAGPDYRTALQFLRFSDRTVQTLTDISRPLDWGLSVSADGRSILFTQHDNPGADLVLVENFR